jgi:hypothetical protein
MYVATIRESKWHPTPHLLPHQPKIGCRVETLSHKPHKPPDPDTNRTAHAMQGDFLWPHAPCADAAHSGSWPPSPETVTNHQGLCATATTVFLPPQAYSGCCTRPYVATKYHRGTRFGCATSIAMRSMRSPMKKIRLRLCGGAVASESACHT